jgi:hypothetical protein
LEAENGLRRLKKHKREPRLALPNDSPKITFFDAVNYESSEPFEAITCL